MSAARPIETMCSNPACRRRQTVPLDRLWFVTIRNGAASHRDAGWACRQCGNENVTPAAHLPKGLLNQLPARPARVAAPVAPAPSTPTWSTGPAGLELLREALHRLAADGGDALALGMVDGRMETFEVPSATSPGAWPQRVLAELETLGADTLILAGRGDDGWRMVLHARTGAATLV